jgi:hypothetical protein
MREKFASTIGECSAVLTSGTDAEVALALTLLNLVLTGESQAPARPKPKPATRRSTAP